MNTPLIPIKANEPQARFLRACARLPVDATPVWFMRQAGRYMPEYRAIRKNLSLLEIVARPEIAAEVTFQPIHTLGVDAAILFADILLPLIPMGLNLEMVKGVGPQIDNPFRNQGDLKRLRKIDAKTDLGHVMEAIKIVRKTLSNEVPLIGFSGAPFTFASYMIEGGPSKDFRHVKYLMYAETDTWHALMELITNALIDYLVSQVSAGAQAIQIFDSWVGVLSPEDYKRYVLPYSQKMIQAVQKTRVPILHFGTNTATLLSLMKQAGGDVIGLDWRMPLDQGWELLGKDMAVQGNLDPMALFAPRSILEEKVKDVLARAGGRPGHIFNLGHGISQFTPPENVKSVVEMVHEWTAK
ncbi:MAG: uroporphyrinogen decarboxylase [Anaerolineae bacterium]|nr:uroporphyrinogen decarboxylase [Anaerolineae bacterium]